MFGYVRPVMDKLTADEREAFQSVYCGLCYELARLYGFPARFLLSYDLAFLAMLLSEGEPQGAAFRCPCKRFCKKERVVTDSALEFAADATIILAYWKMEDEVADSGAVRSLCYRVLRCLATPAYRKAARKRPSFAGSVEENLRLLCDLERQRVPSLDRPADAFAKLLSAAAGESGGGTREAIHRQMLYHLGRWIYLIDALDDLQEDAAKGKYNPLIARFQLKNGILDEDSQRRLVATLDHSVNLICSAWALSERGAWSGVLDNIIYFGLPSAGRLVLEGKWNPSADGKYCFRAGHGIEEGERMEPDV